MSDGGIKRGDWPTPAVPPELESVAFLGGLSVPKQIRLGVNTVMALRAAVTQVEQLRSERDEARVKLAAMHRRAQKAEGKWARFGPVPPNTPWREMVGRYWKLVKPLADGRDLGLASQQSEELLLALIAERDEARNALADKRRIYTVEEIRAMLPKAGIGEAEYLSLGVQARDYRAGKERAEEALKVALRLLREIQTDEAQRSKRIDTILSWVK